MNITYPIIRFLFAGAETLEFSRAQILSATLVEEIHTLSIEIPISTLDFSVTVSDDSFSMFSGSIYALLAERLPILAYESVDGNTRLLGKFYLDKWKNTSERRIEFTATDIIGVLEETDYDGNFYSAATLLSQAIYDLLVPINVEYEFDADFVDTHVSGWIPPGNYRKALQQICFAGVASVYTGRSQKLVITSVVLPDLLYDFRVKDREKSNKSVELLPLTSRIEIVSHNYTQGDAIETIFDQYLEAGSHKIVFNKPYYNVIVSGPGYTQSVLGTEGGDYIGTENGDYIEAGGEYNLGVNAIYLTISTAGTVTITGYPWIDSKRSFTFNETDTTDSSNKTSVLISDASLVSITNAQAVLDKARDYYRQRYVQKIKILPSQIKVEDIVLSNTLYGNKILASVQKMSTELTKGYFSELEIRGIVPEYAPDLANPVRRVRSGIAVSGAELTRNNRWRNYA